MCTGAPCTAGKRVVIWMARIASFGFSGRIDTTSGPWKGPAAAVGTLVRYIGTAVPQVMWRSSMPSWISASSNENEQPSAKMTRSSRQWLRMSAGSSISLAVLEHAVARHVGADVEVLAQRRQVRIARRADREQRAGLGIELAEAHEVGSERFGRIARLPCTKPGARPAVGPVQSPRRIACRASWPVGGTSDGLRFRRRSSDSSHSRAGASCRRIAAILASAATGIRWRVRGRQVLRSSQAVCMVLTSCWQRLRNVYYSMQSDDGSSLEGEAAVLCHRAFGNRSVPVAALSQSPSGSVLGHARRKAARAHAGRRLVRSGARTVEQTWADGRGMHHV
jgi:hypothetical protein